MNKSSPLDPALQKKHREWGRKICHYRAVIKVLERALQYGTHSKITQAEASLFKYHSTFGFEPSPVNLFWARESLKREKLYKKLLDNREKKNEL